MLTSIIIDDEKLSIRILEKFLTKYDFIQNIASFDDAQKALDSFDRLKPDIAFVDIRMPDKNGIELASAFQEINSAVKIIFVTADDGYAVKAFEMVAFDYLVKPLEADRFDNLANRLKLLSRGQQNQAQILTMGGFELKNARGQTVKWRSEKTRELFALLYHHRGRTLSRTMLIDTLWPDHDPDKAQHLLHNGIYYIRKALQEFGIDEEHISIKGAYKMTVNDVYSDDYFFSDEYVRNYEQLDIKQLENMAKLYGGAYMYFENWLWCELDRLELEKNFDRLLGVLASKYEAVQNKHALELVLLKLSYRDPYNEAVAKKIVDLYEDMGKMGQAADFKLNFEKRMKEDIWDRQR